MLPDPYYPVYLAGAQLSDANFHFMPLLKENDFLVDFEAIPEEIAQKAKIDHFHLTSRKDHNIATKQLPCQALCRVFDERTLRL